MDQLNFDGSCDPNPGGRMGFGWVISWEEKRAPTEGRKEKLGAPSNTNNVAEYTALREGIAHYLEMGGKGPLQVCGDSKLVISQMSGKWKVNNRNLALIKEQIESLIQAGRIKVAFRWVPRERNSTADRLAMPAGAQARVAERKFIAAPDRSDTSPLEMQIRELNAHPSPGFKAFAGLKVGGFDRFSRMGRDELREQAGKNAAALALKEFREDERHQASALRWMLRGLAVDLAIRKVKTDIEIASRKTRGR